MRKLQLILILFLVAALGLTHAQTPNLFKYQAALRDAIGNVVANQSITILVEILEGSGGSVVFSETHSVETNNAGLISLQIGSLENGTGTMDAINWSTGDYHVRITKDAEEMGTVQLVSVPYAMFADRAAVVDSIPYENIANAPDVSAWDSNASDDFDGDYANLTNKPVTITQEQSDKIDSITITESVDLDQMLTDSETNSQKVSFPGFGLSEGLAVEGNQNLWYYNNGDMYHDGNVGILTPVPSAFNGYALHVGGGILYDGQPSSKIPGVLYYNPLGEGSFRYYNELNQEKVLGQDSIDFVASTWEQEECVSMENNLVVQGSMSVGFDAVNGEEYGYSTFVLKENNLRILFDDTDEPGSGFPYYDWQLEANESANGGTNHFAIVNYTDQVTPFKIDAGALDGTFVISQNSNVGIGVENPSAKLEVDGSIKADAFIGDGSGLTGITGAAGGIASADTLTIAADTNSNSVGIIAFQTQNSTRMVITNDGKVGIGISSPTATLHVSGNARFENLEVAGGVAVSSYLYTLNSDTSSYAATLDFDVTDKSVVEFNPQNGTITISGFINGISGQELLLINNSALQNVVVNHNGAGTQKAMLPASANITLGTHSSARFLFDGTYWYCVGLNN